MTFRFVGLRLLKILHNGFYLCGSVISNNRSPFSRRFILNLNRLNLVLTKPTYFPATEVVLMSQIVE